MNTLIFPLNETAYKQLRYTKNEAKAIIKMFINGSLLFADNERMITLELVLSYSQSVEMSRQELSILFFKVCAQRRKEDYYGFNLFYTAGSYKVDVFVNYFRQLFWF
jgi:hypothetical protein